MSETHSTNFVPSSKPPNIEVVKPIEVTPAPRKIKFDPKESKPKNPNLPKDKKHDRPLWVFHFCGKAGHTRLICFKLQAAKWANKQKVPMPQAQDPIILISELVKALNLYTNVGVAHNSSMNNNSKIRVASKKFWMQKTQSNWVFLTLSLCFISKSFVTFFSWSFGFPLFLGFALHHIHAFHFRLFLFVSFKNKNKSKKMGKIGMWNDVFCITYLGCVV